MIILKFMSNVTIVTTALCYSNGPLHLGHILEQTQADIWVRYLRMIGTPCIFLSGDDAHGTQIMLAAKKNDTKPKDYIEKIAKLHKADITGFNISFDCYHTTDSEENKELCESIYSRIQDNIVKKTISQLYDPKVEMFLPDRFIKGTCPKCGAPDQYGDSCEVCGACYEPTDLINPYSVLSNAKPITKETEHVFFQLSSQQDFIKQWLNSAPISPQAKNKLSEWIDQPLRDWDITRDAPYFGFKIPGMESKYFYVWMDAPIGYIAALKHFCNSNPEYEFESLWWENTSSSIYHFIGKDIMYFHGIFWPSVLNAANIQVPTSIFPHGFITINKQKMSKSKGTYITAEQYLKHLPADALRYYFASKLTDQIQDIDFSWDDFIQKINTDIVGKIINIGSRNASILVKYCDGKLSENIMDHTLLTRLHENHSKILKDFQARQFHHVIRTITSFADHVNQFIAESAPWKLAKANDIENAQLICSLGFYLFIRLIAYLAPVMPELAAKTFEYLNIDISFDIAYPNDLTISPFPRLFERIDTDLINEHFKTN